MIPLIAAALTDLGPTDWAILAAVLIALAVAAFLLGRRQTPPRETVRSAAPPPAPSTPSPGADAEVITFLALLQEKGRLIDFLMDDVTSFTDAQVGAAARVVHQGCQAALREHLRVEPIASEAEGASISLPQGYHAENYRLLGHVKGEPPYQGTLIHKGWKVADLKLPKTLRPDDESLPHLAAAQVELS